MTVTVGNGATTSNGNAKAAHINMMTDTIIANLPPEGLRSVMRGLLGTDVSITSNFHAQAAKYLQSTRPLGTPSLFSGNSSQPEPSLAFFETQSRYRCLMGCGYGFQTISSIIEVLRQISGLALEDKLKNDGLMADMLESVDGDIVQAVTAVQKELLTGAGLRPMTQPELQIMQSMENVLISCLESAQLHMQEFAFVRGLSRLEKLLGCSSTLVQRNPIATEKSKAIISSISETTKLGTSEVPRMFMGLWQFSSPAWGTASSKKINDHFRKHVNAGFTAYDMADHYGDAEVTFGQFRSSQPDGNRVYCATKLCVFAHIEVSKEVVESNISERLANIDADRVELLQFHWQDYNDHQYVQMAKLIGEDPRVQSLGLCNFDTERMNELVEEGVEIVSNQVQFSLIDLRPTFKMAESCKKHNIKLLTYGSLCGGFLATKWLGKSAPNLFDNNMTPSHRKYFEMIAVWGGWALFQELLAVLAVVAKKHSTTISSAAIRWVLDHDYVGAVIIGARMGISEHVEDNLEVFSFRLDDEDKALIQTVLEKCKARDVFEAMGDCGAEYRE